MRGGAPKIEREGTKIRGNGVWGVVGGGLGGCGGLGWPQGLGGLRTALSILEKYSRNLLQGTGTYWGVLEELLGYTGEHWDMLGALGGLLGHTAGHWEMLEYIGEC